MGLTRSRTVPLIVFLFLAAVSLRGWRSFDQKLELLFEPVRELRHLAIPLSWVSVREARAAEASALAGLDSRRAAARAVLASAQSSAAPSDLALARGRGLVHAEVVDRVEGEPDRAVVRFAPGSEVRRGMPVVSGDHFVGRVASVDRDGGGEAEVDLVTRKEFRVGAAVDPLPGEPAPARLVVGGVVPRGRERGDLLLAASCPSDPSRASGLVRVQESDPADGDPYRGLADGFVLGTLERVPRTGTRLLAVRPGLDYRAGLYQVAVLRPSHDPATAPGFAQDPFVDDRWVGARVVLAGDASFWREGRILSAGRGHGVEDGAAIALGASFLGCVVHAGRWSSSARLLGDAGLEVFAIAGGAGTTAETGAPPIPPIPIGRLVSLGRDSGGRDSDGALLLHWEAAVPRALEGEPVPAVLYTASGQRAVPPGLRIGTCELPSGPGPFVLRVHQEERGRSLARVRVWRGPLRPGDTNAARGGPSWH